MGSGIELLKLWFEPPRPEGLPLLQPEISPVRMGLKASPPKIAPRLTAACSLRRSLAGASREGGTGGGWVQSVPAIVSPAGWSADAQL